MRYLCLRCAGTFYIYIGSHALWLLCNNGLWGGKFLTFTRPITLLIYIQGKITVFWSLGWLGSFPFWIVLCMLHGVAESISRFRNKLFFYFLFLLKGKLSYIWVNNLELDLVTLKDDPLALCIKQSDEASSLFSPDIGELNLWLHFFHGILYTVFHTLFLLESKWNNRQCWYKICAKLYRHCR